MLGDEAAEVVALQGQTDDALHRVTQGCQGVAVVDMANLLEIFSSVRGHNFYRVVHLLAD